MRFFPTVTAALVGIVIVAVVAGAGGAAAADTTQSIESCAVESPSDFTGPADGDAIGYVDGYWYDEPIVLSVEDGENESSDDGNATTGGNASEENTTTSDGNETSGDGNTTDHTTEGTDGDETSDDGASGGTNDTDGVNDTDETNDANDTDSEPEVRDLDASDGLDDRELEAFVARTAARVEVLRCHDFDHVPAVRVENRSAVRAAQRAQYANWSQSAQRFDDARLAAALLVGTDADTREARAATTSAATLGYYDQATDAIVVVSGEDEETRVDEVTLAHELVHALQDQQFGLDRYDAGRTDAALAESGLIEGDAGLVEYHYEQRCDDGDWATECLRASPQASGDGGSVPLELFFFQPYNDGPHFVEDQYESGGWTAVDELYERPPASTKALLFPDVVVGDYRPENVTFDPVTDPGLFRIDPEGQAATDVLGPGTIAAAMLAPTFETGTDGIYGTQLVTNNVDQSTLDPLHPYDYGVDATTGWRGGGLEVYRDEDGRTAARWRTTWTSEEAATTFRERYVELLSIRGAASSRNYVGIYHFPPENDYSSRVSVRQNGTAVTIVHAPDLGSVRALDDRAAQEPPEGSSSSKSGIDASKRAAEDALSGPGLAGAIAAMLAAITLLGWYVARRQ